MRFANRIYAVVAAASVLALAGGSVMAVAAPSGQEAPRAAGPAGPGLPLDRYMVPDAKVTAVVVAQTELEVACLRSLGIQPDSGVASVLPTLPAGLGPVLGSLSANQASASGYASLAEPTAGTVTYVDGLDGRMSRPPADEHAALFGTVTQVGAHRVPAGGCQAQAQRELQAGVGPLPADPRSAELKSEIQALRDPRVTRAFARWSACMRQRGYSYTSPLRAALDPRWAVSRPAGVSYVRATRAQIATASADVQCRGRTGLQATWTAVLRAYQDAIIAATGPKLAQANRIVNAWLANAARLGADTPARPPAFARPARPAAVSPALTLSWSSAKTYRDYWSGLYLDGHGGTCNNGEYLDEWPYKSGALNEWWFYSQPLIGSARIIVSAQCDQGSPFEVIERNGSAGPSCYEVVSCHFVSVDQWDLYWGTDGMPYHNELNSIQCAYFADSQGNYTCNFWNLHTGECITGSGVQGDPLAWQDSASCDAAGATDWH